jgi:hypothetical protein
MISGKVCIASHSLIRQCQSTETWVIQNLQAWKLFKRYTTLTLQTNLVLFHSAAVSLMCSFDDLNLCDME